MQEIRNIWAVGRNYGEHAKELGNAVPDKDSHPMIFLKAGSGIVADGGTLHLPQFSADVHHECEVALRFGPDFKFSEITVSIDLTLRDVQNQLKANGHPWSLAKSFKDSAAVGPFVPLSAGLSLSNLKFRLSVNGQVRQEASTSEMIHDPEKLRLYVLDRFPVVPGDLVMTGTPKGVAQLKRGDEITAEIEGIVKAKWSVR